MEEKIQLPHHDVQKARVWGEHRAFQIYLEFTRQRWIIFHQMEGCSAGPPIQMRNQTLWPMHYWENFDCKVTTQRYAQQKVRDYLKVSAQEQICTKIHMKYRESLGTSSHNHPRLDDMWISWGYDSHVWTSSLSMSVNSHVIQLVTPFFWFSPLLLDTPSPLSLSHIYVRWFFYCSLFVFHVLLLDIDNFTFILGWRL